MEGTGESRLIKYAVWITLVAFLLLFFFFRAQSDVNFCRNAFSGLINGDYSVEKAIDWENLQALGIDAERTYSALGNEKEKRDYRKAFIQGSATGFKNAGLRLRDFSAWRIYDKDNEKIVIACDYLRYNKTLLFTLSKLGKRRLVSIDWENK